jgi:hypothetical protein
MRAFLQAELERPLGATGLVDRVINPKRDAVIGNHESWTEDRVRDDAVGAALPRGSVLGRRRGRADEG